MSSRHGFAPFVESMWTHPETLKAVSEAAGIDLVPIMPYEVGSFRHSYTVYLGFHLSLGMSTFNSHLVPIRCPNLDQNLSKPKLLLSAQRASYPRSYRALITCRHWPRARIAIPKVRTKEISRAQRVLMVAKGLNLPSPILSRHRHLHPRKRNISQ